MSEVPVVRRVLRHIVMFKFKEDSPSTAIKAIEEGLHALPAAIAVIQAYEWGLNNSIEDFHKGFTHIFQLSFDSEADRKVYLEHPSHLAFVKILLPHVDDLHVLDYWAAGPTILSQPKDSSSRL
eukprot:TRINITY_DN460_c0_g1_i1.p2 TRINITY_DN460_c0_g1~~TRINITY_DN460_c0_g1_i1.p2  ORF type:complete len:124 (-),score=25.10 TRINITY_DN460_c0_g1_i1:141-512(-)